MGSHRVALGVLLASTVFVVPSSAESSTRQQPAFVVSFGVRRAVPPPGETSVPPRAVICQSLRGRHRAARVSGRYASFAWSPSGARLALLVGTASGRRALDVVNSDGSGRRRLLVAGRASDVSWAPHGRSVALIADDSVVVAAVNGTHMRVVARDPNPGTAAEGYRGASWLRGNGRIAFLHATVGPVRWQAFSVRPDGSDLRADRTAPRRPFIWSPTARRIAYIARGDLWISRPDGSRGRRVTVGGASLIEDLSWSPDGGRIALLRRTAASSAADVYLVDVTSGLERRLTRTSEDEFSPEWRRRRGTLGRCLAPH
jgi:Tol biopolymer transport system component